MAYRVEKEFKTPSRRFRPGDAVTPADIDGPAPLEFWIGGGFVAAAKPDAPPLPQEPLGEAEQPKQPARHR